MHSNWLSDDQAISDELSDGLAGVGVRDFRDFIGIEPDLSLSAADNAGGEALLGGEVDPMRGRLVHDLGWRGESLRAW